MFQGNFLRVYPYKTLIFPKETKLVLDQDLYVRFACVIIVWPKCVIALCIHIRTSCIKIGGSMLYKLITKKVKNYAENDWETNEMDSDIKDPQ